MTSWKPSACGPCMAVSWGSPRPRWPISSASARETVCRWWTAYAQGGLDALPAQRTGRPLGSGRALSDEQALHIQRLLRNHSPEELGIAAPLWTRRAVGDLIRQEFGIALAVRTVGLYLERWGFTAKRPSRHARDQDPEEVRQWLEETYPAIEERAEEEGAEIHWCDEVGVAADQQPARGYAPEGEPATMEVPDPHIRANQISTITNEGKVHFMTYTRTMTAALFLVFLGRLLRSTTGKVFLIVDRLRRTRRRRWGGGWRRIGTGSRCSTCRVMRRS